MVNITEDEKKGIEKLIQKYVDKDFHENHTWTIYSLIDIKVIYIISAAYISIVNLISSTANIEGTDDKNNDVKFQISSDQRGFVTEISDYVLWNCRPHSVSEYYYKLLYWMLLTGLIAGLSGFFVVKLIALINIGILSPEHALTRLWHIAVYEKGKGRMISKDLERMEKVPIEVFNEVKCSCANIFRTISSLFFLLFLVAVMFIAYLSYDIHPIACIRGQADTSILYDGDEENRMGRVEINLSPHLKKFQLAAGIIIIILVFLILLPLACCFYCFSYRVIQAMKEKIKDEEFISNN